MSTTKFLTGVLTGLTTGLVIGLLTAPESGEKTRKKIRSTADDWRLKINNMIGHSNEDLTELKEIFEHEISGLQEDVRERVLRLINKSRGSFNQFKREALS